MNNAAIVSRASGRGQPGADALVPTAVAGFKPTQEGHRRLYGALHDLGFTVECHDFEPVSRFEWSRCFIPGSLELCLNLAGEGSIEHAGRSMNFAPLTSGFFVSGKNELRGWRKPGGRHRFLMVRFASRFLREHLLPSDGALHPLVERFLSQAPRAAGVGEIQRLTTDQERWIALLPHPPTPQAARRLWYRSKVLQLMAEFFFIRRGEDELFCDRQKRLARERVDRVIGLLKEHLADPPGLDAIGREAGCSPFHLSRTFSRETGMTIPQYLRKLRIERAAELLRTGRYNVTEAALEVGYSSLSHFSQAFCQLIGCCPALYPPKRLSEEA